MSDDGTILAIGATHNDGGELVNSGHVRVYQRNGTNWDQLGSDIDGEDEGDWFGGAVSLSDDGTILAIGATQNDDGGSNNGHVRVYQWDGASWAELGSVIVGEFAGGESGAAVSLSGDGFTLAVGAPKVTAGIPGNGRVRVYQWRGHWDQLGTGIDGEDEGDFFGGAVSLSDDGTILAIGATHNDDGGSNSGHVRVYQWRGGDDGSWAELGSVIVGEDAGGESGAAVSLSGDGTILAVGATKAYAGMPENGRVRVYQWNGEVWNQLGNDIDGEAAEDESGGAVSLSDDGSILAIGAKYNDGGGSNSGHVRLYQLNGANWDQVWDQLGSDIDGEAAWDQSGGAVSLSGDGSTLAIGAPFNNGNGAYSGHVRVYVNTVNNVDCVGAWSDCAQCQRTFTVTTPSSGEGVPCDADNGATEVCGGCSALKTCYTDPTQCAGECGPHKSAVCEVYKTKYDAECCA